jgi:hypothetical protein
MTFDDLIVQSVTPAKVEPFVAAYREAQYNGGVGQRDLLPMRTLARMLANITLTEYIDEDNILFRIAGDNIVDRLGFNPAGRNTLDLIAQEKREDAIALHHAIISHPCGSYVVYESIFQSGRRAKSESITFPLKKDANSSALFFLSYHIHHEATGVAEVGEATALGLSQLQTSLIDIGFGVPENSVELEISAEREDA